jgi:hypothetical protein
MINSSPMLIMAKEIKYNHNSITIPEIKKKVDFPDLTTKKIPDDWTLETKTSCLLDLPNRIRIML